MKNVEEWKSYYDSKDPSRESLTELADWRIKGVPMTEQDFYEIYIRHVIEHLELRKSHSFLEIGCGSGLFIKKIDLLVGRSVATDFSRTLLNAMHCRSEKILCTADELPFREREFDRILMHGVVVSFPSFSYLEKVIVEALRVLNDEGILIIGDVPVENDHYAGDHIRYDQCDLTKSLESMGYPFSIIVAPRRKRRLNNRKDIIIYKERANVAE